MTARAASRARRSLIWRDDDISAQTRIVELARVDDLFQARGVPHTAALIVEGLDRRPDLIQFLRTREVVPELHCWSHEDLTRSPAARAKLPQAVRTIEQLFGRRPTTLYPPWNRTDGDVDAIASDLGLRVSVQKISLSQYLRVAGDVGERVVNFHYWDVVEARQLQAALRVVSGHAMKVTDYAPRSAPFDSYLWPLGLNLVGAEIGVDVGAHAEALLRYCPIALLHLIDPWPRDYAFGYCEGRLHSKGWASRIRMVRAESHTAAAQFADNAFDFLYFDQHHEREAVAGDLQHWWSKLRVGGLLGYRNYAAVNAELKDEIDQFVERHKIPVVVEAGEIVLTKK